MMYPLRIKPRDAEYSSSPSSVHMEEPNTSVVVIQLDLDRPGSPLIETHPKTPENYDHIIQFQALPCHRSRFNSGSWVSRSSMGEQEAVIILCRGGSRILKIGGRGGGSQHPCG